MRVAPMGEVRNNFAAYIDECEKEPVFITRNGRIAAVIEHIEDCDVEDYLLERSARFRKMLDAVKGQQGGMRLREYRKARKV